MGKFTRTPPSDETGCRTGRNLATYKVSSSSFVLDCFGEIFENETNDEEQELTNENIG
jgi:hypothetical protein